MPTNLVLFLNKERSTNNSIITSTDSFDLAESRFYRKKSSTPYNVNVRLDLDEGWTRGDIDPTRNVYRDYFSRQATPSEQILSGFYVAEYSLNNSNNFVPITNMAPFDIAMVAPTTVGNTTPIISSIYVKISGANLYDTEKIQTLITFADDAPNKLSATAFAIEDVSSKTLYTFIWGKSGISTEVDTLTSYAYYRVPNRVIFNFDPFPQQAVSAVIADVYDKLLNYTEMKLLTSANAITIIQINNERFTYPVSAYGGAQSTIAFPLLSTGIHHISMSAIFLDEFPTIEHISYPTYVIDETKLPLSFTKLDYSNFRQVCSSNSFYGEGHTETINLSCSYYNNKDQTPYVRWLVGNNVPPEKISGLTNSYYYINPSSPDSSLATAKINTYVTNKEYTVPVNAMLLDEENFVDVNAPIISYNDFDGNPYFYPFYSSTVNPRGEDLTDSDLVSSAQLIPDPFKKSITVKTYPNVTQIELGDPFAVLYDSLPYNFDSKRLFSSIIFNPALTGILTENLVGTNWGLKAYSSVGTWSVNAVTGPTTTNYVFELGYDKDYNANFLPPFKTSPLTDTTLLFEVTCTKLVKIDFTATNPASSLPPDLLDWSEKIDTQYFGSQIEVSRPLVVKPFTKNYYNLKNIEVPFILYHEPKEPFVLSAVELKSQLSQETLMLTPQSPQGNIIFNKVGLVDMDVSIYLFDTKKNELVTEKVQYLDCLEVLEEYDVIDENSLNSTRSSLILTYKEPPLISPNEWLIDDNINDSLKKLYTVFDEINEFTTFYEKRDKLFGWFGLSQAPYEEGLVIKKYAWQDLECAGENVERDELFSWFDFECNTPNLEETTRGFKWEEHECPLPRDPSCMQRHCLDWRWKKRQAKNSPIQVTWASTKQKGEYEKRWKFEKCQMDSDILNCGQINWNISYLNPRSFPIPLGSPSTYCRFVDFDYLPESNLYLVAHEKEIRILGTGIDATPIYRRGIADELFSFQNIVGIAVSSSEKIYVLDQLLPRVSVFQVVDNEIVAIDSWGDYGLSNNPIGFNKPTDIHIDQFDFIWITDNGNKCVKKYTATGKPILTLKYTDFDVTPPLSVCVDVDSKLHVLTSSKVIVFDSKGNYEREYSFDTDMTGVTKINSNYNRHMLYISYKNGVAKYFKIGKICHYTIKDYKCTDGQYLNNFGNCVQDKYRNLYVLISNKVLKFGDVMKTAELKGTVSEKSFWKWNEIYIHKEEYVQPWVYLKSFHRLWDNFELLRSSLFFENGTCKEYAPPKYDKTDLVIGQNELVTNAVINRLINQIWENVKYFINYFDPNCKK